MDNARITYRQRPDTIPQAACDVRARVWGYVFRCYEAKRDVASEGSTDGGDEATGSRIGEIEKGDRYVENPAHKPSGIEHQ